MESNDHTCKVEQRVAAIKVASCDTCAFFKKREGALTSIKICFNCAYALFNKDNIAENYGLCKYRIQR